MPAPFPRPTGMLHELLALLPDLGVGVDARRPLVEPMLVHPARDPPAPFLARALRLERTGATRRGRIGAHGAPQLKGADTKAECLTGWPAIRVCGRLRRAIVLPEES
jgi:hypothetical protein